MPQSLILITVDCFRADHAGFHGYARNTTPFLDSLAASSTVFLDAIVAGAPTYYSVPAIMASRYPLALGRDVVGLAPGEPTIATELHDAGYATAAFLAANPYLSATFGYDRGFDVFRDFLEVHNCVGEPKRSANKTRLNSYLARTSHLFGATGKLYDELYFRYCQKISEPPQELDKLRRFPSADIIVDEACNWLENVYSGTPFFLWLHFMDPHSPYYPKQEALEMMGDRGGAGEARYDNSYWNREDLSSHRLLCRREEVIALYDAGIRWVDTQIARLSEHLRKRNLWEECVLAVTADHGEEFLEHGGRYHSPAKLTEELIHVPLLLHDPRKELKEIWRDPFSLLHLAPTLFGAINVPMLNVPIRLSLEENSFAKSTEAGQGAVIVESVGGCTNPMESAQRVGPRMLAVRESVYKLVIDFKKLDVALFNLQTDSAEAHPLPADAEKPVRRRLLERARKHLAQTVSGQDLCRRLDVQLRELRINYSRPVASVAA
jgi:arylsulfatase A-like enzyme